MSIKTKYANLLNALNDMASSPAYALRREDLRNAERIILAQEQQIKQLEKQLNGNQEETKRPS